MSQKICGMNLDEYIQFYCEFVGLFRAISDGDATDDDIIPFLKKHGQEPVFAPYDPEEIDPEYYMGAGLKPWEDVIIKDPQMQSKKAMGLINWQNRGIHGDSEGSSDIEIEGLSLDAYAHVCAVTAAGGDINPLYEQYGIKGQDHFNKINAAYQSAMSTDATGMLATHYSDFYMKHSPQHAANVNQAVADAMAESTADLQAKEKRDIEVNIKLKEMARAGNAPEELAAYVKNTITDAEDEEELDYHLEPAADELAEEKKWDAVKIILQARFITLQPGGSIKEWVNDEFESLKDDDDD